MIAAATPALLGVARFADLPLSPHFRSPRVTDRAASPRRRTKSKQSDAARQETNEAPAQAVIRSSDLHPFLQGLLRELPDDGAGWTQDKRNRWLQMAELTVDMLYPVADKK